jgi:hypothetical protein
MIADQIELSQCVLTAIGAGKFLLRGIVLQQMKTHFHPRVKLLLSDCTIAIFPLQHVVGVDYLKLYVEANMY